MSFANESNQSIAVIANSRCNSDGICCWIFFMTHLSNRKKGSFLFEGASSTNQYFNQVCQKSLLCTYKNFSHEVLFLGARDIFVSNFSVKKRLR